MLTDKEFESLLEDFKTLWNTGTGKSLLPDDHTYAKKGCTALTVALDPISPFVVFFGMADKGKKELLDELLTGGGEQEIERAKMSIIVRCTEDLVKSIHDFTHSNNKLSNRLLWLNIILGAFTVIGTVLAVVQMIK